jgi:3',5'-cyclic AMP phosphodiesterase CpdA
VNVRILHLSDTHVMRQGALLYGATDTREHLTHVLERFRHVGPLDAVVVSGDCSDDGSVESYRFLAEQVGSFAAAHGATPLYSVGNHDDRGGFAAVLGSGTPEPSAHGAVGAAGPTRTTQADAPSSGIAPLPDGAWPGGHDTSPSASIDAVHDVAGFRFLLLDTQVPGHGYGDLSAEQVDAARAAALESDLPCVLVLHHPPIPARTRLTHVLELRDPSMLMPLIDTGRVAVILSGHYHHALAGSFAGVPVFVAPAVADVVDPSAGYDEYSTRPGWGAQLVDLTPRGRKVDAEVAPVISETGTAASGLDRDLMLSIARNDGPHHWRTRWEEEPR